MSLTISLTPWAVLIYFIHKLHVLIAPVWDINNYIHISFSFVLKVTCLMLKSYINCNHVFLLRNQHLKAEFQES